MGDILFKLRKIAKKVEISEKNIIGMKTCKNLLRMTIYIICQYSEVFLKKKRQYQFKAMFMFLKAWQTDLARAYDD